MLFKEECDCEYMCDNCCVVFTCDVSNEESNDSNKVVTVSTADLVSENPNIRCIFDQKDGTEVPIVKLAPGQSLKFKAYAYKGIGREHAKWSPVCACICDYHVDPNADKVTQHQQENNPNTFEFSLETSRCLKAKQALTLGFDVLIDKLQHFEQSLDIIKF